MNLEMGIPKPTFIHLKDKVFAEYNFIYHINDGYSISDLLKFTNKDQLLFKKINGKVKQMNLMIIDSVFPILLADLTLDIFLNRVSSFDQYCFCDKQIVVNDIKPYSSYIKYKLDDFIYHLLFSNISSCQVCKGDILLDKIYYLKDMDGTLQYYSLYEQKELKELMFRKMKLQIDLEKSFIKNREVSICLQIFYR